MREIKFRALRDDKATEWVYGSLIYSKNDVPLIWNNNIGLYTTCLKGTESQFTGLKDKNGKKIYEGDIVYLGDTTAPKKKILGLVKWNDENAGFGYKLNMVVMIGEEATKSENMEVIGNIWENKELLENG